MQLLASCAPGDGWFGWGIEVGGVTYYSPDWTDTPTLTQPGNAPVVESVTIPLPADCPSVDVALVAYHYPLPGLPPNAADRAELAITGSEPPPSPTPEPSATPESTGWISGSAVIHVTGATTPPDDQHDKGIIFSLDGLACEVAWARLRSRNGEAEYQLKGIGNTDWADPCWGEWNYYQMRPAADGDWTVTWEWMPETGSTEITVECPNGESESIALPYAVAFDHVTLGTGPCPAPNFAGQTTAELVSFNGELRGTTGVCQ